MGDVLQAQAQPPEQAATAQQLHERFAFQLEQMPALARDILLFHKVQGLSISNISTALRISRITVQSYLRDALAFLSEGIRSGDATLSHSSPGMEQRNQPLLDHRPLDVMLQAVVSLGKNTSEGAVVEAVSIPWLAFIAHIKRNPDRLHEIDWRKWEEIIAGGYKEAGFSVVVTQRRGDKGRDIIATKSDLLSVRYFDQVKAYAPGNLVTLDQVHSMLGVLSAAHNVSKGIITTTSNFAPGVYSDPEVRQFMPYRLDLRPRDRLIEWLSQIAQIRRSKSTT
jgi:restriction system protein